MPTGIDGIPGRRVRRHLVLLDLVAIDEDGAAMLRTHMEEHALGVVVLIVVAVDTMVFGVVELAIVLIDDVFVEVFDVALVESNLAIELITGLNQTIRQVAVDGLLRNVQAVFRECNPRAVALGIKGYGDVAALRRCQQLFPLKAVEAHRAVVIGTRTYGKGLVQSIRDLPYNTNLKLTTAKYYIPSGRCIQEIDYKQRRSKTAADSTNTTAAADSIFHTRNGRTVMSGRGIRPDVEVHHDTLQNIVYYLSNDDVIIRYGTKYVQTHTAPASVADFSITDADFSQFKQMVLESKFTYDRLSERRLQDLKKTAQFEGYYDDAKAEFDALEAKLSHNLEKELDRHEHDIRQLLAMEIVKRYFYEAGTIQETLKDDTDLKQAIEILSDADKYNKILNK